MTASMANMANMAKSSMVRLIKQLQSANCSSLYSFTNNYDNNIKILELLITLLH